MRPRANITNAILQKVLMKNKDEVPFGIMDVYYKHINRQYQKRK
jgi:hypothetical protein